MSTLRAWFGCALVAWVVVVAAPHPHSFDAATSGFAERLDSRMRVPFAAVLLRTRGAALQPGERVLGLRLPGDAGLIAPRDRDALLRVLEATHPGDAVRVEVRGPRGARTAILHVATLRPAAALVEQWPALLASGALLLFALGCLLGGRHPVATPLFAVSLSLGTGIATAVGVAMPGDPGFFGIAALRSRVALLAWCALPAALLHLAARFPVVTPRFRRRGNAALPYALWALPALVAQARFGEPATVDAVERVALAASFLAGAILIGACALPPRRLSPVERARARAAMAAFLIAGAGPLAAFVAGTQPPAAASTLLALGAFALPIALGWTVVRYRLLDPPAWIRHLLVSAASAGLALLLAAAATSAAWEAVGTTRDLPPAHGAALALGTALVYQSFRSLGSKLASGRFVTAAPGELLARASRELAGARNPREVLERLATVLERELRASEVESFFVCDRAASSPLAQRALAIWRDRRPPPQRQLVFAVRSEDPDRSSPELVLSLEPRAGQPALVAVAPRRDSLPYAPEELRAAEDVARLATLALGDATASALLEARVAARTAALQRAADDRSAVLEAATRVQSAARIEEIRTAATRFLAQCTGVEPRAAGDAPQRRDTVHLALDLEPTRSTWLLVDSVPRERASELQPQTDAVAALANVALERIHLLASLKRDVTEQARELARLSAGQRCAEFVRGVAHELRKPTEEIRQLAQAVDLADSPAARPALARIEAITHELGRRLDCLLSRDPQRLDLRRVDLVRLVDAAAARVARLRSERRFRVEHALARLPLLADPLRIASLVENLLDNAVKATTRGGAVAVRSALVRPIGSADARVALEIEDDGGGIPPELGDEIFEPGVGRFRSGFGLGLALCRDVVTAHGGSIEVESAPGRTVFRALLPQSGPDEATS